MKKPIKTELGVSRSNYMVTFTEALEDIDGDKKISFHEISEYPIGPFAKIQSEEADSDSIKHYSIAVFHDEKINNLIIKYSYLGIPFKKEIDLSGD